MAVKLTAEQARHLGIAMPDMRKLRKESRRSRKANRHGRAKVEIDELRPAGTVICEGAISGRAVPWKAPGVARDGGVIPSRDYGRYTAWREQVATLARSLMGRRRLYGGPVDLHATFYLRPNGHTIPDRDNLQKAFSDAIQGAVIVNDVQIEGGECRRVMTSEEPERVEFRVIAL